ncbi:Hypothetical predicted protein [Prunus dulcis]|uniref:Uncharacterized protein n=1 Tax=Prunus dulcis TaxID=3755 RepID=A0A5E4FW76_PRUDU|nr:Hypothetical predicted protein [Prunus dulcis]
MTIVYSLDSLIFLAYVRDFGVRFEIPIQAGYISPFQLFSIKAAPSEVELSATIYLWRKENGQLAVRKKIKIAYSEKDNKINDPFTASRDKGVGAHSERTCGYGKMIGGGWGFPGLSPNIKGRMEKSMTKDHAQPKDPVLSSGE